MVASRSVAASLPSIWSMRTGVAIGLLAAATAAAVIINTLVLPGNNLASSLYAVPILIAAFRLSPRGIGSVIALVVVLYSGSATLKDYALATQMFAVTGLLLVGFLALQLAAQRSMALAALQSRDQALGEAERLAAERAAVLGQIADGVIITDPSGRITFVNETARQLHGVAEMGVPVEHYSEVYHLLTLDGQPHPPEELPLARAVLHGETVRDARWRIRRPDGTEIVAEGSSAPVNAIDGTRLGNTLALRDVTAQYDLDRLKGDFLAAVAHDLNNPLTVVKANAQLLGRSLARPEAPPTERLAAGLASIEAASSRMAALVATLLDLTQLELHQSLDLDRRPTDLVALARQIAATHQSGTAQHRLQVETAESTLVGSYDAPRLERALDNLLGNAIKYSPAGGAIAIRLGREEDAAGTWARVAVQDQGLGIQQADLPRVFDRFHRGANVVGQIAGTGIGLAGVKQIVEQHGGRVTVESRLGAGATFTVWLPLPTAAGRDDAG